MSDTTTRRREVLVDVDADTTLHVLIDAPASEPDEAATGVPSLAPTIVLLPSSQRDSLDLDTISGCLAAAGFRVLRPQPRGMARSRGPLVRLDLNVLACDVARVIERCAASRAIVAGHAFGHYVARVTDLNHPALVRGVVVLGGAARTFPAALSHALDLAADSNQPREERLAALRQAFFAPGNNPEPWLDGWYPSLRDTYRRAGTSPAKDAWWPVTHSPILEVQGECDPWRPPSTRDELRAVLANRVTLRLIANASHALLAEQPAAVAQAIVEWAGALPD